MTALINVSGQAKPAGFFGADHLLPEFVYMTLGNNVLSVETNLSAIVDGGMEGWESVVFKPRTEDIQFVFEAERRYMAFIRENVANPELLPNGDYDGDGLPDRWELANGFDPFTPGEGTLDPDKDGLTNLDEAGYNTNPKSDDSDGDGEKDFADVNRAVDPGVDFLEVLLQTRDTGKVNNGANCAVCHTTQLKVGEFSHFSKERSVFSEKKIFLRKGTNYPIYLSELVQNLPPATQNSGSPTTTATYSANVLPAANQPVAFVVQDSQTKLGTNKPWSNFPADPSVAVATLIVPKIEVSWTNMAGNVALDANPNAGGGLRVFPDALNPNDFLVRNRVRMKVKTTPALPGQQVLLKSFDPDDPFVHPQYSAVDTDPTDAGGERGDDNLGIPGAGALAATTLTLDAQGEAFTDYAVTYQPGNNFRVAAVLNTPGAQAHLDQLQVTNATRAFYVTADTNAVAGFVGGISPMLTTWRKLHLEFDSMVAPPASGPEAKYTSGTVTSVRPNFPVTGRSRVSVRHGNTTGGEGHDFFERGKLEIPGVSSFMITNTMTRVAGLELVTYMDVLGLPNVTTGAVARLYDDDDQYLSDDLPLYPSILGLQSPPLPLNQRSGEFVTNMQPTFALAYILLIDANAQGWNSQQTISFQRRAGHTAFDNGNLQLKGADRFDFWAFSVVFGYEATLLEDGDPDLEIPLSGVTPETSVALIGDRNRPFGYSVIYLEDIRDYEFGVRTNTLVVPRDRFTNSFWGPQLARQYRERVYSVTAHELGHAPGRQWHVFDHQEDFLMVPGAPNSLVGTQPSWKTIRRFRGAESWTK